MSNAIKPDVTPEDGTRQATGFVPTGRLDALTDAVFAFAMTLLVINIELPDDFHPKTTQAFLQGLAGLSDTFIAYLITFLVLVAFWTGRAQKTYEPEMASAAYVRATLFHLLWVTVLPFSMLAVSRYDVAGAVWLYGANMILLAVTGILISRRETRQRPRRRERRPRRVRPPDRLGTPVDADQPRLTELRHSGLSAQFRRSLRAPARGAAINGPCRRGAEPHARGPSVATGLRPN